MSSNLEAQAWKYLIVQFYNYRHILSMLYIEKSFVWAFYTKNVFAVFKTKKPEIFWRSSNENFSSVCVLNIDEAIRPRLTTVSKILPAQISLCQNVNIPKCKILRYSAF